MILSELTTLASQPNPLTAKFSETSAGLIAKFTDSSTDALDTITSRTWNFGDGSGPATATNPSHLYVKAGVFTVTETVNDAAGYSASQVTSVTIK